MKAGDLITELQRFDPDQQVCVEVEASTGKHFDADTCSVLFSVDSVAFENTVQFGVKIILEPC